MRLLLVEDDRMIGEEMLLALKKEAYTVDWARDGQSALDSLAVQEYALALLDLGLPARDGMSVLAALRERSSAVPVIVVTARDGVESRILGLDAGADDYVIKPFVISELLARIRAVIRRKNDRETPLLSNGAVTLDRETRQASCGGLSSKLSAKEYALLRLLLSRPGSIFSRQKLEDHLYGWNEEVESNAVEVLIHAIRKKLGKESIVNVRGAGWMVSKGR